MMTPSRSSSLFYLTFLSLSALPPSYPPAHGFWFSKKGTEEPSATAPEKNQAPAQKPKEPPLGSRLNPLVLAMVPSLTNASTSGSMSTLTQCLLKTQNLFVDVKVPQSYTAVVEGLGAANKAGAIHAAMLNSKGFELAYKRFQVKPLLTVTRKGANFYRGVILTHAQGPIKSPKDLKGRTLAVVDLNSTSTLYALKYLEDQGLPRGSFRIEVAGAHDKAVLKVSQRLADAAAVYWEEGGEDARVRVKSIVKNVMTAVVPLGYNEKNAQLYQSPTDTYRPGLTEPIINEPLIVRNDTPPDISKKLSNGFVECAKTNPDLFKPINGADGFVVATVDDYKPFLKVVNSYKMDTLTALSR